MVSILEVMDKNLFRTKNVGYNTIVNMFAQSDRKRRKNEVVIYESGVICESSLPYAFVTTFIYP